MQPGDGHALPAYRPWQVLGRSLFHLHVAGPDGAPLTWSVDVGHGGDDDGEVRAALYLDGRHHASSTLPAVFPVTDGVIEVAVGGYGMRRAHHVRPDGSARPLAPDPASAEGWRTRLDRTHPVLGRAIAVASVGVLLVALVVGVPQAVEQLTSLPPVAGVVGAWTSPLHLPEAANVALTLAAVAASTERALRLRYSQVLDGGFLDGDE